MKQLIFTLVICVATLCAQAEPFKRQLECNIIPGPGVDIQHCVEYEMVWMGNGYLPYKVNEWWTPITVVKVESPLKLHAHEYTASLKYVPITDTIPNLQETLLEWSETREFSPEYLNEEIRPMLLYCGPWTTDGGGYFCGDKYLYKSNKKLRRGWRASYL